MEHNYFEGCGSLEDIRNRYRQLALKHHPDRGGDTATMQEINRQYARCSANATATANPQQTATEATTASEVSERIRAAIEAIVRLPEITIEICGYWVWVNGNTFPIKEALKAAGFRFSPKKKSWYFAGIRCNSRRSHDMSYIRDKYGSAPIDGENTLQFAV